MPNDFENDFEYQNQNHDFDFDFQNHQNEMILILISKSRKYSDFDLIFKITNLGDFAQLCPYAGE